MEDIDVEMEIDSDGKVQKMFQVNQQGSEFHLHVYDVNVFDEYPNVINGYSKTIMDRKGRFNMMGVNVDQNVGKRRIQKTLARRFVNEPRTISEPRDKEATHVHEVQVVPISEPRVVEAVETVEESCGNQSSKDDAEWSDSGEEDWEDTSTEEDSEEANVEEGKATSNDEEEIHWSSDEFKGLESDDEREVEREKGFMLEKGKVYGNIHMFRAALADYAVHKDGVSFMIKTYNPTHTCKRKPTNKNANSRWIAEKLGPLLKADPLMSDKAMSEYLEREYQVKPHDMQLYRAKRLAREKNEGDHAKSYALLPRKQKAPVSTSRMATRSQTTNASTVESMQEKKMRKMKEYLAKRRARMAGAGGDAIGASSTSVTGRDAGAAGAAGAGGDGGDGGARTDFFEHLSPKPDCLYISYGQLAVTDDNATSFNNNILNTDKFQWQLAVAD
ncbi:hypothetical protein NE237_000173 [Protea cynaroides]|uniref:Uncharacterized protein n=1 Tax=Protea cynaroides TaxID=273540 RepID=A0A9Q0KQN9_9MAGN|nr:hypothetical protein NE237_000173 [Protea cynaroides]